MPSAKTMLEHYRSQVVAAVVDDDHDPRKTGR